MWTSQSLPQRQRIATGIALAFHISGLVAIGWLRSPLFISLTPLNLLICLALVIYTQPQLSRGFFLFAVAAFAIGFGAEYVGVNTGLLFGQYSYGSVMGPGLHGVPWLIGVQWLVTMYCLGVAMHLLHGHLQQRAPQAYARYPRWFSRFSLISDGAVCAVIFDWVLEPVAIQLGYWKWDTPEIPTLNYFSWYVVSLLVMWLFHRIPFPKRNLFGLHLLMIQFMFFLLMRILLSR